MLITFTWISILTVPFYLPLLIRDKITFFLCLFPEKMSGTWNWHSNMRLIMLPPLSWYIKLIMNTFQTITFSSFEGTAYLEYRGFVCINKRICSTAHMRNKNTSKNRWNEFLEVQVWHVWFTGFAKVLRTRT